MGRSPCCDKVGLKKGPWTPEEDQKLLAYIEEHGHGSWRALPAKAGEIIYMIIILPLAKGSILNFIFSKLFISFAFVNFQFFRASKMRQELPA